MPRRKNWSKDHLHIRGEYFETLSGIKRKWGSPPHTWRILDASSVGTSSVGITSTYVENTSNSAPRFS